MNNVNNSTKGNIILNTIKDSMNCSMVFDKTSFLMISGAWARHEREKKTLPNSSKNLMFLRHLLLHITLKQRNYCLENACTWKLLFNLLGWPMLLLRKQLSWKQVHTGKKMMQNFETGCFNPRDVRWATVYSERTFLLCPFGNCYFS